MDDGKTEEDEEEEEWEEEEERRKTWDQIMHHEEIWLASWLRVQGRGFRRRGGMRVGSAPFRVWS
jgi:hypothetical protein